MKKILPAMTQIFAKPVLALVFAITSTMAVAQTTATNFTCNDCAGVSHTLFDELDAGMVIVICWVMPCGTCINPASTASTVAQGFASSHPGRVKYYMVDDYANSTCSTINTWANTYSISKDAWFSDAAISMSHYGTDGMPKTVVLGGTSHTVFYNVNGTNSTGALQTAINNALNATAIAENESVLSALNIFPNPVINSTTISYSLVTSSDVKIEIFNMIGEKVKSIISGKQTSGEYKIDVHCSELNNGIYFLKFSAGQVEKTIVLPVSR